MEYGGSLFSALSKKTTLDKFCNIQPSCLRTICQLPRTTSGAALERQLMITPVKLRLQGQTAALVERGMRLSEHHILKRSLTQIKHHSALGSRLKDPTSSRKPYRTPSFWHPELPYKQENLLIAYLATHK